MATFRIRVTATDGRTVFFVATKGRQSKGELLVTNPDHAYHFGTRTQAEEYVATAPVCAGRTQMGQAITVEEAPKRGCRCGGDAWSCTCPVPHGC